MKRKEYLKWYKVEDKPLPHNRKPVLVRLDKEENPVQVGYFDDKGLSSVGFYFAFDLPKIMHWAEIPNLPDQEGAADGLYIVYVNICFNLLHLFTFFVGGD